MIEFYVSGHPVAQGRPRAFQRGGHIGFYDPKESKAWKALIAQKARNCGVVAFDKGLALALTVIFHIEKPKSVKRDMPTVKPDLDNFVKAVKDALKGIAWDDDSQVCRVVADKKYNATPGVWIGIQELKD
jgi:Holliday junction resolvase RusA-like endonuclease